jgi:hydrogenase maturation protease
VILAFALGNPLRGDDAAGAAIARGLPGLLPGLELVEVAELLPEQAEEVARADGVIFLDAFAGGTPGEVRAERLSPRPARGSILHALLPEELLGLAIALHGRAAPAALIAISGRDFSFREGLSPEVEAALPAARRAACRLALAFTAR